MQENSATAQDSEIHQTPWPQIRDSRIITHLSDRFSHRQMQISESIIECLEFTGVRVTLIKFSLFSGQRVIIEGFGVAAL